jgi:hypothetical protein
MARIFSSHDDDIVRDVLFLISAAEIFERGVSLHVCDQRSNAAGEPKNPRPAFALDLLGAEAERGNAAIH